MYLYCKYVKYYSNSRFNHSQKGAVVASTGSRNAQSFIFSILDDITVPVYNQVATFTNIPVFQGSVLTSNYTYSARNVNQRFELPNRY